MIDALLKGQIVKVCMAGEVEKFTEAGWNVVDIREEAHQEHGGMYYEDAVNPHQENGCYGTQTVRLSKESPSRVVSHLVFILIKGKDTVIEEVRKEKDHYSAKADEILKKLEAAEKNLEETKRDLERVKTSRKTEEEYRITAEARARNIEASNRKLEEHIAKLRKEIGDGRFREIVGEEKKAGSLDQELAGNPNAVLVKA